ncbi:MAG TPA: cupin domain-containing protein [Tepidiformaceae bacterium]|nr:cupin domain-containing protein [Tepidiformaceae bacterium]
MVKVIRKDERDCGTAQTPGMVREAGISAALCGSDGLWMGTATNEPGAVAGAHHHGSNESGIYILRGRLRFRWGDTLENVVDVGPGDFVFVPPYEVHMEENIDADNDAELILARNSQEAIVVNVPDPR